MQRNPRVILVSLVIFVIGVSSPAVAHGEPMSTTCSWEKVESLLAQTLSSRLESLSFIFQGDTSNFLNLLNQAIDKVVVQDEDLRFSITQRTMLAEISNDTASVTVGFEYAESAAQYRYVKSHIDKTVGMIISPGMTDDELIKAVHDYLVKNLRYDTSRRSNSPYDGLTKGLGTCNAYALLTYRMLRALDIEAHLVSGMSKRTGENHAWNLVRSGSTWFHLDVTWDDPVPDRPGEVQYDYFMLTDTQMMNSHHWEEGGEENPEPLPSARLDYFDHLQQQMRSAKSRTERQRYQNLLHGVGLHYLLPEFTVSSASRLTQVAKDAFAEKRDSFAVRYTGRFHDVESLLQEYVDQVATDYDVSGYRYSFSDYQRTAIPHDVVIEISQIAYRK